jgi:hypothetical protein
MMLPFDRLKLEHRKHYRDGALADFIAWFERSGFGDMLDNPYLSEGPAQEHRLSVAPDFSALKSVRYRNIGQTASTLSMQVHIERGAEDMQQLFENFVRCTGHTHLFGDFRKHIDFFSTSYTGPRYVLFDGAGTCLLLGSMFQALAKNLRNEDVALHYSHTSNRELTHVFASWNGNFVDPDQKTWVPLTELDDSAVFGYLFQQFGVSAYQVFLAIDPSKRRRLFSRMSRDYFDFYDDSRTQYMYRREQAIQSVSDYFKQAREKHCSDLDIYATDFPWKAEFRAKTEALGFQAPYFLSDLGRPVKIEIPAMGSFEIGLYADLPIEAEQLASIFLGRVPGTLRVPLVAGKASVTVPELPWMVLFEQDVETVKLNGHILKPWLSQDGRHRLLGTGDIEAFINIADDGSAFSMDIESDGEQCAVVLPINAFALSSGLVDIGSEATSNFEIDGWVVQ